MATAAQFINYYPKYSYLDNLISTTGAETINIFVDLKGCMQSVYQEWAIRHVVDHSRGKFVDSSLFAAAIEFIAFHKKYAKMRNIDIKLFFFFERGSSTYHEKILKTYKSNRRGGDFFGLDEASKDLFFGVLNKNFEVIHKVCNKLPNVYSIWLQHLEADFVPWHLRKHVLGEPDAKEIDVVYSLDKDMLQCMDNNYTFQFYRHYKQHKMLSRNTALDHYFKQKWPHDDIGVEYFSLILAIDGDISDDFKGVKGFGPKTIIKQFPAIVRMLIQDNIYDTYSDAMKDKPIFKEDFGTNVKALLRLLQSEEIVRRNLKLCSYKILSDTIMEGYPLTMNKTKQLLAESTDETEKIANGTVLYTALEQIGMTGYLSEDSIYNVF